MPVRAPARQLMRSALLLSLFLSLFVAALGCTQQVDASPLPLDFQLEADQHHVKNPDISLKREYWVVVSDGQKYFMFPRPDGADAIARECTANGPMASTFRAASLCAPAGSTSEVNRVNALSQSEAFTVSTFLHARLRFAVGEDRITISPYPLLSDVVEICKSYPKERLAKLETVCNRELGYEKGGARPAIYIAYSADEASTLSALLNDWYGVPAPK